CLSYCLRLSCEVVGAARRKPNHLEGLCAFGVFVAADQKGLWGRYRLVGALLAKLGELKAAIETALTARSPLERYHDIEPKLREKWENELAAAIEAEYRLQRAVALVSLQWWLRDVWLKTLALGGDLLNFP